MSNPVDHTNLKFDNSNKAQYNIEIGAAAISWKITSCVVSILELLPRVNTSMYVI